LFYWFERIAFSNTLSTPLEVEDSDPWKYIIFISGNFLQNYFYELLPLKLEINILIESDLELPGLPMMRMGILFMMQTIEVKIFSIRAELKAMFSSGDFSLCT
jgi:hypothetical protein